MTAYRAGYRPYTGRAAAWSEGAADRGALRGRAERAAWTERPAPSGGPALADFRHRITTVRGRPPGGRDSAAFLDGPRPREVRALAGSLPGMLPATLPCAFSGRRRRHPFLIFLGSPGESLLLMAGLSAMGLAALLDRLASEARRRRLGRYRVAAAAALAAACIFLLSGVSVYAVVLPQVGVHAPGQNLLHRWLSRVPGPWRPVRPAHVAPPDGAAPRPAVPATPPANYSPSAVSPVDGFGPGVTVPVATIGDAPPVMRTAPDP